ncbi:hypothetical protein WMY93_031571, partial [Mugilogobius chulae]
GGFNASLKLKLSTQDEVQEWLEAFQASSKTTWRVQKTYPNTPESIRHNKYRVDLRCQRGGRNPSSKKNTFCPAVLYLVLKKDTFSQSRKSRSNDPHIQDCLSFHIKIRSTHNHEINCSEALQYRHVSKETIKKIEKLFESGHSPSSALNTLKYDLQEEMGESYVLASADRSVCPDLHFCFRMCQMIIIQQSNQRCPLHSPHEACVHKQIERSGEIMFIDSSGNSFFGRGEFGPEVVMSDDCKALQHAQLVYAKTPDRTKYSVSSVFLPFLYSALPSFRFPSISSLFSLSLFCLSCLLQVSPLSSISP